MEQLRNVMAELQAAIMREQVKLNSYTGFENFYDFHPSDRHEESLNKGDRSGNRMGRGARNSALSRPCREQVWHGYAPGPYSSLCGRPARADRSSQTRPKPPSRLEKAAKTRTCRALHLADGLLDTVAHRLSPSRGVTLSLNRVLISGAGIAGPSLAYWLHRHGVDVTIVDRAPEPREGGAAVDFRGAQVDLLRQMGILDEVRRHQTGMGDITLVNRRGRPRGKIPGARLSGEVEILRGEFSRILLDATKGTTDYVFGDRITSITDGEDGAHVTFEHGPAQTFDIVIGADGSHSGVRNLVFGAERTFSTHLGYYAAAITAPNHLGLLHTGILYNDPGRAVLVTNPGPPSEISVVFMFAAEQLAYHPHDLAQQRRITVERCADMGWDIPKLLSGIEDSPDFFFTALRIIRLDRWSSGRTVLLGDAAWAAGISAFGTSTAMRGARTLADRLAESTDHSVAFDAYEQDMRATVKAGQSHSENFGAFIAPQRRIWLRNLVLNAGNTPIGTLYTKIRK